MEKGRSFPAPSKLTSLLILGVHQPRCAQDPILLGSSVQFSSVQLLPRIQLFVTLWTAARQASLSVTKSRSLLKLMSIESVMPSNHLILCCPLLLLPSIFPGIRVFSNESVRFKSGGQRIEASASASVKVFPMLSLKPAFSLSLSSRGSLALLHFLP